VSVGDECYLALPKGGLINEHVLIVTIQHISATSMSSADTIKEIARYKESLRTFFATKDMVPIMFERHFQTRGNSHAHIQV
jgi:hypothetical protein